MIRPTFALYDVHPSWHQPPRKFCLPPRHPPHKPFQQTIQSHYPGLETAQGLVQPLRLAVLGLP